MELAWSVVGIAGVHSASALASTDPEKVRCLTHWSNNAVRPASNSYRNSVVSTACATSWKRWTERASSERPDPSNDRVREWPASPVVLGRQSVPRRTSHVRFSCGNERGWIGPDGHASRHQHLVADRPFMTFQAGDRLLRTQQLGLALSEAVTSSAHPRSMALRAVQMTGKTLPNGTAQRAMLQEVTASPGAPSHGPRRVRSARPSRLWRSRSWPGRGSR